MAAAQACTVAVAQTGALLGDLDASLARVERLARRAAEGGARLVVFPEAVLGGYPKGDDFGLRVGTRGAQGRELFRRYGAGAVETSGPEVERLGALARETGAALVVGVVERARSSLFCTALFLDEHGTLAGLHRKLVPTGLERVLWSSGDGSTMPVVATPAGRAGAAICWESYLPLYRQALYDQGLELYCAPTVDDRDAWIWTMRHVAVEGRCFVLSACQLARRADWPPGHAAAEGPADELVIRGGSCIVDPFGELLAGPVYGEEALLLAELDRGALARARLDLDVAGHSARRDLFELTVDARPRGTRFLTEERP